MAHVNKWPHSEHKKHLVSINCTFFVHILVQWSLNMFWKREKKFLPVKMTIERACLTSVALFWSPFHADTTLKVGKRSASQDYLLFWSCSQPLGTGEGIVLPTWTKNFSHSVMIAQALALPAKADDIQYHTSGCLAAPWDTQLKEIQLYHSFGSTGGHEILGVHLALWPLSSFLALPGVNRKLG